MVARIRVALSSSESFDIQNKDSVLQSGLCKVVEGIPCYFLSVVLGSHLLEHRFRKSRWACATDDLVEIELELCNGDAFFSRKVVEPLLNVLDQAHHDWQSWLRRKGPLTERLALRAQDRMVNERRLIDLDTNDHVDIVFVVPLRDKPLDGTETLDINVGVDSSFSIHDEVSQQVSFDDGNAYFSIQLDDVGAIQAMFPVVPFHIRQGVVIGQNLVAVTRVLGRPCLRGVRIALFEGQWTSLPGLPDLARNDTQFCLYWLLVLPLSSVLVCGANRGREEVRVGEEQDQKYDN